MVTLSFTMTDATAAPDTSTVEFSLELNQDQKDIQEWVHGFAEKVVRPAVARSPFRDVRLTRTGSMMRLEMEKS